MNKICTSLEQSKKLIELGIDIDTADMCYINGNPNIGFLSEEYKMFGDNVLANYWPAWSLSALLDLMPKSICIKQSEHSGYFYFLEWQFANDNSLRYVGHDRECLIDIYSDHDDNWKDSIDTAFEMICWLKENGKI